MLATAVHLTGYRFFVAITNSDQTECYLVFLGKIGEETDVTHFRHPSSYFWHVKLDELNIEWRETISDRNVYLHFFVFLPTPEGWRDDFGCPYLISGPIWERHPGDGHWGQNMGMSNRMATDKSIQFKRRKKGIPEEWEITSVRTDVEAANHRLHTLVRFYKHELEKSSNIRAFHRWEAPQTPVVSSAPRI